MDYSNLDKLSKEEVARLREEAERARITARELRLNSVGS
jgi:hypothetical protein